MVVAIVGVGKLPKSSLSESLKYLGQKLIDAEFVTLKEDSLGKMLRRICVIM